MKFTGIVDSVPSRGGGGGLKIDPQMVEKTISELLAQSQDKMISIALEAGDHAASICGSFFFKLCSRDRAAAGSPETRNRVRVRFGPQRSVAMRT